jgi:flagellar biosynthetic protein FliR
MELINQFSSHPDYVFLLFLRVSGLLISSPIFGRRNVPRIAKVGFCLVISAVFLLALPAPKTYPVWNGVIAYMLLCVRELLFGVAMGFVMSAMFDLVLTGGSMIDTQIGFSMMSLYDTQSNSQAPITGTLFQLLETVLFFGMDGHLRIIDVLYATIQRVPVGKAMLTPNIAWVAAKVMSTSFALSLMMAMPIVAAGIMLDLALGAIIRTVPQMNMFVVGIPLKIVVGLLVLAGTFPLFMDLSKEITAQMFSLINQAFACIGSVG